MGELGQQRSATYQFGVFELSPQMRELRKHGVKLKLQEQPLQVLLILLERPGEVVTRQEIQKRLWPEDTYVDFDNAINSAVRKVRDALCDNADNPKFIETLARRGYRFIAPVNGPVTVKPIGGSFEGPTERQAPTYNRLWLALAAVVLLVLAADLLYRMHSEAKRALDEALPPPVPLTSYPGFQWSPSFSPDGTRVAFTWEEAGKRLPGIYVKLIGPSDPVRIAESNERDFGPAWSPDGRWIAFLRMKDPFHCAVMLVPSLGGTARELVRVQLDVTLLDGWRSVSPPFLAWSSDGKWLLAPEQPGIAAQAPVRRVRIVRVAVESGEKSAFDVSLDADPNRGKANTALTSGEESLSVSPDGKKLAFIHEAENPSTDIYVMAISDEMTPASRARSLHFNKGSCFGIAWTTDGRSLIASSDRRGSVELWRVPIDGSVQPARIDISDEFPESPAVARTGERLAYTHFFNNSDIWRLDLTGRRIQNVSAFIASTKDEFNASYSPDGHRIAFESNRSGSHNEIWVSDADGSGAVQLTFFGTAWAGTPRWSPDGQRIAFDCNARGRWNIYVIPSQGGKPIRFTSGSGSQIRPSWSHDGKWIYYCASGASGPQIWKKAADGEAEVKITRDGGCNQMESPDGRYVYYLNKSNSALWRVPVAGGAEEEVAELGPEAEFALGKNGVYYVESMYSNSLKFLDFRAGATKLLGVLPGPVVHGIAISPDDRWLLYDRDQSGGSQIRLVEKFR